MVFTLPVGYSRPPSAVNDPTVTKQVNSGKSCLEEVSQSLRGDSRGIYRSPKLEPHSKMSAFFNAVHSQTRMLREKRCYADVQVLEES